MTIPSLSRRDFLKLSATAGALTLSIPLLGSSMAMAQDGQAVTTASLAPNVFVSIDAQGLITITCHRSEMGQQVRTAIAQIIADELDADWSRVRIEQATGDPRYGDQNTDGSRSIRRNLSRLQNAGATAAHLLVLAASQKWKVNVDECVCHNHEVVHQPSGKRAGYGELVDIAAALPLPEDGVVKPKAREHWRYIGKPVPSIELDAVVSGTTTFGQDVQVEGMAVAVIQRPPVLFSYAAKVDDKKTRAVPGVIDVITLPKATAPAGFNPLGGVAVIAESTWAAMQGLKALSVNWAESPHSGYSSFDEKAALVDAASTAGEIVRQRGDAKQFLEQADEILDATYYAPMLSQAPMEPPAATASVLQDKATIWACTQTPQSTRAAVARALGMEESQVTVNVTLLGGGFGRKSKPDFSVEAALLSKAVGRPVKVIWRREDDIQHGYYHTVSAQHIRAALDGKGRVAAWHHKTVFPSISSTFAEKSVPPSSGEMRLGFIDNPFDIPNLLLEKGQADAHVRIGWLRSVANVYHAFAIQSFADELAVKAQQDSRDFLLSLIGKPRHIDLAADGAEYDNYGDPLDQYPVDTGRLRNVIERVCEQADWGNRHKQKRFLGLAAHRSFLSYVATVVEIKVDADGTWHIPQVFICIDAGTVVNPEHVRAQCEGGSIYGLSCALGQITAEHGAIQQSNFHDYQVARMQHAPRKFHVDIVDSKAPPAGVGEPPTPPFTPALTNALFAATGKRIRMLPVPLQLTLTEPS